MSSWNLNTFFLPLSYTITIAFSINHKIIYYCQKKILSGSLWFTDKETEAASIYQARTNQAFTKFLLRQRLLVGHMLWMKKTQLSPSKPSYLASQRDRGMMMTMLLPHVGYTKHPYQVLHKHRQGSTAMVKRHLLRNRVNV